jgi:hypothetical protein
MCSDLLWQRDVNKTCRFIRVVHARQPEYRIEMKQMLVVKVVFTSSMVVHRGTVKSCNGPIFGRTRAEIIATRQREVVGSGTAYFMSEIIESSLSRVDPCVMLAPT